MNELKLMPFGPLLAKTEVSTEELELLREYSKHTKENINDQLAGCCEHQLSFEDEYNKKIFDIFKPRINEYLKSFGVLKYETNYEFTFEDDSLWIVNQKAGEFNPMHSHSSDISFVVYLDIPNEIYGEGRTTPAIPAGAIEFVYGKDMQGYIMEHFLNPINSYIHVPQNGDMFIFPSMLNHHVNRFKSDVVRKSLAGNARITNIVPVNLLNNPML